MRDPDLLFRPVSELRQLLHNRALSAVELAQATLDHVERLQPRLNAFITITHEAALAAAHQADRELSGQSAGESQSLRPLLGIPYSVKDLTYTAGVRTTMGSHTHADFVPDEDAIPVARLKAAGAVLIGKTTTPAFGHKPITEGKFFGETLNPWNTKHTCGGSSGGAGAAVAAGMAPLALGTDGGGSVRIPSACCGIVGLKQTLGMIPHIHAPDLFGNHSFIGPMARTVADCRTLFQSIAGGHPMDPYGLSQMGPPANESAGRTAPDSIKGLRLGWMPKVGNPKVDADVAAHSGEIVAWLAGQGAEVDEIQPDFATLMEPFNTMFMSGLHARLAQYLPEYSDRMDSTLLRSIEMGGTFSASELQGALMRRSDLFRQIQGLFEQFDFLISPTLSRPALKAGHDLFEPIDIAGEAVGLTRSAWYPYTIPFNLTGHPALSIPAGLSAEGLPTAFQIVGPWYSEQGIFDLAQAIETMRPWVQRRPLLAE